MTPDQDEKTPQEGLTKGGRFFFNLFWSTSQALADAAGSDRAWELIKPYLKLHFDAATQMLKDKFKLKTDDLYSLAVFLNYFNMFSGIILSNHNFFEHGYITDIHYCPFANLSEVYCRFSGEYSNELIMQAINSGYEVIYTRKLVRGDPLCQLMVSKKGHTIWGEVAKKPVEIPIPHWSDEEREYWQSAAFSQSWIYETNALVDFAGKEKAVEILRPYMKALGKSIALDLSKELGIGNRDAISIASIIEQCNQAANQKGEYIIHTPGRVEKELTECIFQCLPGHLRRRS